MDNGIYTYTALEKLPRPNSKLMEIQDRLSHMGVSPKHGRVALALQAHMLAVGPEIATFVCLNLICYVKIKWKGKKNNAKFTGH